MKRVFQLVNWLNMAGTETVFMNWYRYIDREQLQFDFLVDKQYDTPLVDEIIHKGGKIYIIPQEKNLHGYFRFYWKLYRLLKKNGPYVAFQSHNHWLNGLDCMVAFLAGIKKRFTISHYALGMKPLTFKRKLLLPLYRLFIYLFSTDRLAVSEKAGLLLYGKHMSFKLVHNGIDLKKFAYNPIIRVQKHKELDLEDKFVIGHVGRFAKQKNHDFLIDIFAEIYKKNRSAHLVLLGVGELEEEIQQKVKKLGLTKEVSFVGARTDVQNFYQAMDIFVFPSLYEGLGIVAIEAQCSGLPCVMSDVIPKEAFVCNATAMSLQKSSKEWADIILKKTKDFKRKDESASLRIAGFDAIDVGKFMQQEYLK